MRGACAKRAWGRGWAWRGKRLEVEQTNVFQPFYTRFTKASRENVDRSATSRNEPGTRRVQEQAAYSNWGTVRKERGARIPIACSEVGGRLTFVEAAARLLHGPG